MAQSSSIIGFVKFTIRIMEGAIELLAKQNDELLKEDTKMENLEKIAENVTNTTDKAVKTVTTGQLVGLGAGCAAGGAAAGIGAYIGIKALVKRHKDKKAKKAEEPKKEDPKPEEKKPEEPAKEA